MPQKGKFLYTPDRNFPGMKYKEWVSPSGPQYQCVPWGSAVATGQGTDSWHGKEGMYNERVVFPAVTYNEAMAAAGGPLVIYWQKH